jgi:hypothetical protein
LISDSQQQDINTTEEPGFESEPVVTAASLGFTEVVSDQISETGERVIGLTNEAQDQLAVAVVTEDVTYLLRFNDEGGEISWDLLNDLGVAIATVFPDFVQLADGTVLSLNRVAAKSAGQTSCSGVDMFTATDPAEAIAIAIFRCSDGIPPQESTDQHREFVQAVAECLIESPEIEAIGPICADVAGVDPVTCECLCGPDQSYDAVTDSCVPVSTPAPEPTPSPSAAPTATPFPTTEPTTASSPTPTPSAEPTATPAPTPTPVPTATPSPSPSPTPSSSPGGIADYAFRKSIAIDHTRVGLAGTDQETLVDFPVLVSVTDVDLRNSPEGHVAVPAGGDIAFFALSDDACGGVGTSPCGLDYEIEKYDPAIGQLVAWVRVPQVATSNPFVTTDTVIHLYYGNPDLTASVQDSPSVWAEHYEGVWHLDEAATDNGVPIAFNDSTSRDNDLENHASAVGKAGMIGSGQEFDGVDDYAAISALSSSIVGNVTISAWFRAPVTTLQSRLLNLAPTAHDGLQLVLIEAGSLHVGDSNGAISNVASDAVLSDGEWHHAVVVRSETTYSLYVDGAFVASGEGPADEYTRLVLARRDAGNHFQGSLDEVRLSAAVLTPNVIRAEYNNQQWPNKHEFPELGFISIGAEEANPIWVIDATN